MAVSTKLALHDGFDAAQRRHALRGWRLDEYVQAPLRVCTRSRIRAAAWRGSSTQKLNWLTVNCALRVRTTRGARSYARMFTRPDTPTRRSVPASVSRG